MSVEVDVARFTLGPIRRGASAARSKSSSRLPGTMLVVEALDDHGARPVPRAVSCPGLALAIGQADRHELGPQVVHTEWMPYGRPFKNLGPCDARRSEIVAQVLGHLVDRKRPPGLAENMIVLSDTRLEAAAPKPERSRHSRIQRPRAGIVGLVLVKTHRTAGVLPLHAGRVLPCLSIPVSSMIQHVTGARAAIAAIA